MLLRAVWAYWFNTSMAGVATDPDLKELRKPWADPIVKENIMYSGHLLMMVSLYAMLFDDDEFEKTDSLKFLIGVRLRDARQGTNVIEGVLAKYKAAWDKKGLVGPDGLFPDFWLVKQDFTLPAKDPAWTAWGCAFMNAWNSTFVRSHFDEQSLGFVTNTEGEVRLNQPSVGAEFRKLVKDHGASSTSRKTLETARQNAKDAMQSESANNKNFPYTKPTFGYIVQWLSELGKDVELKGLLEYADRHLKPEWDRGGLYYPRNDKRFDDNLDWTHMDPFSGNAAIGYARLNVEDGQKIMWERPWTADDVSSRPFVDGVTLDDGVDFIRGDWDHREKLLVLTVRAWDKDLKTINPVVRNLEPGSWNVFIGGELKMSQMLSAEENIALEVQVGDSDLDIVVVKQV
ncbi:hypothetical protein EsH8_VIII_000252 [Colletotrichum jinshuiense]